MKILISGVLTCRLITKVSPNYLSNDRRKLDEAECLCLFYVKRNYKKVNDCQGWKESDLTSTRHRCVHIYFRTKLCFNFKRRDFHAWNACQAQAGPSVNEFVVVQINKMAQTLVLSHLIPSLSMLRPSPLFQFHYLSPFV